MKKSNPMRQLCQWWYRRIQVRARVKIKQSKSAVSCAIREMQAEQRRSIYVSSQGRQNHAEWLRQRQR